MSRLYQWRVTCRRHARRRKAVRHQRCHGHCLHGGSGLTVDSPSGYERSCGSRLIPDAPPFSRICLHGRVRDLPVGLAARAIAHRHRPSNPARRPDTGHRHGWCARDGGCMDEGWRLHTPRGTPGRVRRPPRDYPPLRFNSRSDAGQRGVPSRRMDGSSTRGNSFLAAWPRDCPSRWQGYRRRAARCCEVSAGALMGSKWGAALWCTGGARWWWCRLLGA